MAQAKNGDSVVVSYVGRLKDGTVFDSSEGKPPLRFTLGSGEVIPGFDQAIVGMDEGTSRSFTLTADQGYGLYREGLILRIRRSQLPALPEGVELKEGMQFSIHTQGERPVPVVVKDYDEETVTLDANHPLSGKDLDFEVTLVQIVG